MRSIPILDLKAQLRVTASALEAMTEVMDSQYFILGPRVRPLRRRSAMSGSRAPSASHRAPTRSSSRSWRSTSARRRGHHPAKSFFATAGVVARLGATPVFVDVDPLTYNVTEELVRDTERTRAIILSTSSVRSIWGLSTAPLKMNGPRSSKTPRNPSALDSVVSAPVTSEMSAAQVFPLKEPRRIW